MKSILVGFNRGAFTKSPLKNNGKREQGQGLVEFALVIPFLMVMVITIIEAAWMMFFFATVSMSAREAARYGAALGDINVVSTIPHYQDCAGIRDAARRVGAFAALPNNNQIEVFFDSGPGTTQVQYCAPDNPIPGVSGGQRIIVKVIGHYQPLINFIRIPSIDFKSETAFTIMSDIKISQ